MKILSRLVLMSLLLITVSITPIDFLCLMLWQLDDSPITQSENKRSPLHHPDSSQAHQHDAEEGNATPTSQLFNLDLGDGLMAILHELLPDISGAKLLSKVDILSATPFLESLGEPPKSLS